MKAASVVRARRFLGEQVYIAYLDDSKQERSTSRFQVMGAVIIKDEYFDVLEQHLGYNLHLLAEQYVTGDFEEFHASDLLAGNPPFKAVERKEALNVLGEVTAAIALLEVPIVYGAANLSKLYATAYATANPVDIAFRLCVQSIEQWFVKNAPDGLGLLISDNSDKGVRRAVENAFHLFRNRVRSSPAQRGELEHLHDDMYFGDSKYSIGIQLADICMLLIGRHLVGCSDTEDLYQSISKNIFKGDVLPE
ncbi:MAG: DUF3800 domain-containing protein [Bryobacteraceae bacterium]